MKKVLSVAVMALMMAGATALACETCGCQAEKKAECAACAKVEKCEKCGAKQKCEACTAKKAAAKAAAAKAAETAE